ncbi:Protein phosphatase methylesterase 1, partial [Camelus dromedarius]
PGRKRDFSPVPWSQYFESMEDVEAAIISRVQCRIVALDLRGHGETKVKNSEDLSAETMAKDVGNVVEAMYGDLPPPIMLIGHSMGGAIAVHTASSSLVPSLLGLCMIDVVEGTAMDALNSMQNFLRGRPKTFNVKSGQIRNLESARVSMVGQVKQCEGIISPEGSKSIVEGIIEEEEEDEEGSESVNKRKKEDDMEVGVDRLDKDLTIGQMQGKFQMQVLPQCGHAVHEDAPDKVAEAVATFLIRHRFAEPIGGFQCPEEVVEIGKNLDDC